MPLKKLRIKNFQGYEDAEVEFGPGFNAIVGENDCGKTSIFRDIIWILKDRPRGEGMIRKGQSDNAFTSLETDSCTVTREKGKGVNQYTLSGVEEPYTAFGSNPPEDIVEALNFEDINIQSQLDPHFLVLSSPGQVAQHIRSISGLDVIDRVISLLKSKTSEKTSLKGKTEADLKETENKLAQIEKINTERLGELICKVEDLVEENKEIVSLEQNLQKIINELKKMEEDQICLPDNTDGLLENADKTIENVKQARQNQEKLSLLLKELNALEAETVNIPESKVNNIVSRVEPASEQYNITEREIKELSRILSELQKIETWEKEVKEKVKQEQITLFSLLDQITTCPYCTSKLNSETKEKLLENY